MPKVRIEIRNGIGFAYLDHRPLRAGDEVHLSKRHRPTSVPAEVVRVRFVRAAWSTVEVEAADGRRFVIPSAEAYFVRNRPGS